MCFRGSIETLGNRNQANLSAALNQGGLFFRLALDGLLMMLILQI